MGREWYLIGLCAVLVAVLFSFKRFDGQNTKSEMNPRVPKQLQNETGHPKYFGNFPK